MSVQNFKGDALELKMRASAEPAFDLTGAALDDFNAQAEQCDPFLLSLYDSGRMPYSDRIERDVFASFIKKALENFPFIGNFESYILILTEIFGPNSQILFAIPSPGILTIDISAEADISYGFVAREYSAGVYTLFDMIDDTGEELIFRGVPGIDSQYKLGLLFSEIMPAGISPDISLAFYSASVFIGEDSDGIYEVRDDLGDTIIFIEAGG